MQLFFRYLRKMYDSYRFRKRDFYRFLQIIIDAQLFYLPLFFFDGRMYIVVQSYVYIGMTKQFAHRFYVDSRRNAHGGKGMAECMTVQRFHIVFLLKVPEEILEVSRLDTITAATEKIITVLLRTIIFFQQFIQMLADRNLPP